MKAVSVSIVKYAARVMGKYADILALHSTDLARLDQGNDTGCASFKPLHIAVPG